MIKIDLARFNWNEIYRAYGIEDNKICSNGVIDKVYRNIKKYTESNSSSTLSVIYKEVFGDGNRIEKNKIIQLLLGISPKQEGCRYPSLEEYKAISKQCIDTFEMYEHKTFDRYYIIEKFNKCSKLNTKVDRVSEWVKDYKEKLKDRGISDNNIDNIKKEIENFLEKIRQYCNEEGITEEEKLTKENKKKILTGALGKELVTEYEEERELIAFHFSYSLLKDVRHQIIGAMNIGVCPYCNRQYISTYTTSQVPNKQIEDNKITADLDHYYPKSKYPYLALSLFNFIPSCQICNSRFKGDKNDHSTPHLYPYEEEFGDQARFTMKIKSVEELLNNNYRIEIHTTKADNEFDKKVKQTKDDFSKKVERSKDVFRLEDVYQVHKDYVSELIQKAIYYNNSQLEEYLMEYKDLFSSEQELIDIIFGRYVIEGNYSAQPLSKLAHDILEELGIRLRS